MVLLFAISKDDMKMDRWREDTVLPTQLTLVSYGAGITALLTFVGDCWL